MGIAQDLDSGINVGISVVEAVCMLAEIENVSECEAAIWLHDQRIADQLVPVFIDWSRRDFGPRTERVKGISAVHEARSIVRDALVFLEKHAARIGDSPALAGLSRIGWLRDDFWSFVLERGIPLTVDMFPEPIACPSFLQPISAETQPGSASAQTTDAPSVSQPFDDQRDAKILNLSRAGVSHKGIAEQFGISRERVGQIIRKKKIRGPFDI